MKTLIIIITVLGTALLTSCKPKVKPQQTENPVSVNIGTPVWTATENRIFLSGNIEGSRTVKLGFLVAGRIENIRVNEGEKVRKGELLANLDETSYALAKELADIQLSQAEDEFDRLRSMYENKSLSESDFSKITHSVLQAKANQKLQAKNLAETKLYSPIEGVLLKKLSEAGEITGVGYPVLVVSDIRIVKVNAFVPEQELHKISIGKPAEIYVPALPDSLTGKIIEVGSAADPASRSFLVRMEVANPGLRLKPGMIAEIIINQNHNSEVLTIPSGCLLHNADNQSYVFTIDSKSGKALKRVVNTGRLLKGNIEIISGLTEIDTIVTGGHQKLTEGSTVEIIR